MKNRLCSQLNCPAGYMCVTTDNNCANLNYYRVACQGKILFYTSILFKEFLKKYIDNEGNWWKEMVTDISSLWIIYFKSKGSNWKLTYPILSLFFWRLKLRSFVLYGRPFIWPIFKVLSTKGFERKKPSKSVKCKIFKVKLTRTKN